MLLASIIERIDRLFDPSDTPTRIHLIVAPQRSGSTLLLNCLRSHPAVQLRRGATIYRRLQIDGRRYPRDLAAKGGRLLEVKTMQWSRIPVYAVQPLDTPQPAERIFIEKIHPHFYNRDEIALVAAIRRLPRTRVSVGVHLRDPRDALQSFLAYQERRRDWYPFITAPAAFLSDEYLALERLAKTFDGHTLTTYSSLTRNMQRTLAEAFADLWPTGSAEGLDHHATMAAKIAAFHSRPTGLGDFAAPLSDRGPRDHSPERQLDEALRPAMQAYERMRSYH